MPDPKNVSKARVGDISVTYSPHVTSSPRATASPRISASPNASASATTGYHTPQQDVNLTFHISSASQAANAPASTTPRGRRGGVVGLPAAATIGSGVYAWMPKSTQNRFRPNFF